MKYLLAFLSVFLFASCKHEPKKPVEPEPQLTILDSIALAYGYANWSKVNAIQFTFNVVRDPGYKRHWKWDVRRQEVTSVIEGDTARYFRNAVDSTLAPIDARFINDKYWLLVPFNLVWDKHNFSYSTEENVRAPITQQPCKKLTIVYGNTGGYTPGDAYDFYLSKDLEIKEWAWRKGNDSLPGIQTLWSDPKAFGGITLTEIHSFPPDQIRLFFTDIAVDIKQP